MQSRRYRIGSLLPMPSLMEVFDAAAEARSLQRQALRALTSWWFASTTSADPLQDGGSWRSSAPPDVRTVVEPADPDHDWVHEVAHVLEDLTASGRRLRLLECSRGGAGGGADGIAISAVDAHRSAVIRAGDVVCAGFAALREEGGDLVVLPRIYRRMCRNGAVVFSHLGADELSCASDVGGVGAAVTRCLSQPELQATAGRLRRAARTEVHDVQALLHDAAVPLPVDVVLRGAEEPVDTVWGVLNAVTAQARRVPAFRQRLAIEQAAERILQAALAPTAAPAVAGFAAARRRAALQH